MRSRALPLLLLLGSFLPAVLAFAPAHARCTRSAAGSLALCARANANPRGSGRPMLPQARRGGALVPLRGGKPALDSDADQAEVARATARR
ncbi:hypothetical protein T484DRAFT_1804436, partial [Baffinella frigidus]